jgi:hypothetical protein
VAPKTHGLTRSGAAGGGGHDLASVRAGGEPITMAWDAEPTHILNGLTDVQEQLEMGRSVNDGQKAQSNWHGIDDDNGIGGRPWPVSNC